MGGVLYAAFKKYLEYGFTITYFQYQSLQFKYNVMVAGITRHTRTAFGPGRGDASFGWLSVVPTARSEPGAGLARRPRVGAPGAATVAAAAFGPVTPTATLEPLVGAPPPAAERACCSSRAFCSGVYTATAKPVAVRMAPCGVSTSPRAHAGPAAAPPAMPAGEKRPIAAIWDAAALAAAVSHGCTKGCELWTVETSFVDDDGRPEARRSELPR